MNEHDYEPVPGLPARLPAGEAILWQGAPQWKTFARRAMRVRLLTAYFVALAIWDIAGGLSSGLTPADVAVSALRLAALAAIAIALLGVFAMLVARTTLYTITTQRVVMRFGIALPITIQISFRMVQSAGLHVWSDGSGDIALTLSPGQRIAYLVIWPHARPWKLTQSQPMLRCIPDACSVAQVLGRALAASASQTATVRVPVSVSSGASAHVAATA